MSKQELDDYFRERGRLLAEHEAEMFPRGESQDLVASADAAYCPMLIEQGEDRHWKADEGTFKNADLPAGGNLCTRFSAGIGTFHLDRGKSADPKFYADPRAAMDLMLKGLGLKRSFGSEEVLVTSLGAPAEASAHRDRYGRRWVLDTFNIPYLDARLVVAFLPVPDGYAGILQLATRGGLVGAREQIRFCTDYFQVSYTGTVAQWQGFLARADLRPAVFDRLKLARDASGLHYQSRRVDLDIPPPVLELQDSSPVQIHLSYALEGGAPVWDISAIYVSANDDKKRYIGLVRQPKPGAGAGKELTTRWTNMLDGKGEFLPERGHDSEYKTLWRRTAVSPGSRPGSALDRNAGLLYEVFSVVEGATVPRRIDDMQDVLLENLRIKER